VAANMAGFATFAAGMAVRLAAVRATFPLIASVPSFAFTLAGAVLISSMTAALVMPERTALVRDVRGEDDPALPAHVTLLLVLLCGVAMLQVPGVVSWWRGEQAILATVLPARPHESGFEYIPMALAYALPALATLTLLLFAITSLLAIVAPSKLVVRVIGAGVLLQLGYIAAAVISGAEVHTIAAALGPLLADDRDAARTFAEWFTTHEGAAGPTTRRLVWTSAGYIFAAVVAALSPATEIPIADVSGAAQRPPASTRTGAGISHVAVTSDASASFDASQYSVRPRMTPIEAWLTRKCTEFEVRCIPHTSRKWFSFSWTNGVLTQQPEGKDLAKIIPPRSPGLFRDRKYDVVDAAAGHTIARFVPRGQDWEITDPSDALIARVLRDNSRSIVTFRAMIGEAEVVRFKWALAGLSVHSAELEVEFVPAAATGDQRSLDRLLAIAIAPILEQRLRVQHERANS
jgi:hypothetical protein